MGRKVTTISVEQFAGLNINSPKSMLKPEELTRLQNFILRRGGSLRLRPGYARMLTDTNAFAFIPPVFSDDFEAYTIGQTLGSQADWTELGDTDSYVRAGPVTGQAVKAEYVAGPNCVSACYVSTWSSGDDHYAEHTLTEVMAAGQYCGPMVRVDPAGTGEAYLLYVAGAGGGNHTLNLYRFNLSTYGLTAIAGIGNLPAQAGDVAKLAIAGGQLRAYYNGVELWRGSEGTISTGYPGLWNRGTAAVIDGIRLDDFNAGVVSTSQKYQVDSPAQPKRIYSFERTDGSIIIIIPNGGQIVAHKLGSPEWTE